MWQVTFRCGRDHHQAMIIIGLTGGMAMGKSTAARFYRRAGVPVFDADATVHQLQAPHGAATPALQREFPEVFSGDGLDRARLRQLVFSDRARLKQLEAIMHPLVRSAEAAFLARCRRHGEPICVLDIPLLFETGADARVDLIVTMSAPLPVQVARIRAQRHLPEEQIRAILARQAPDHLRIARSDIVVRTGLSRYHAVRILTRHLFQLRETLDQ